MRMLNGHAWSLWGTCVFLAACSRTAPLAPVPQPALLGSGGEGDTSVVVSRSSISGPDTSLIVATALSIADSARGVEVRLDPRRLPAGSDAPDAFPTRAEMADDPGAGASKVADLVQVAIREPDLRRMAAACAGRSRCPERNVVQIVLGTPRPGGPREMPRMQAPLPVKPTFWTIRVISTIVRPGKGNDSTLISDYVFDKTPGGWVLVRVVPLFSID